MSRVTIYIFDILLSQFGTSLFFHVWFYLLLLDVHTDFSGGRSGGLVFPPLEEFSSLLRSTQSKALAEVVNITGVDIFPEFSCFFDDPIDVGNLTSDFSAFSKSSLNIWKFMVHILWKTPFESLEHYLAGMCDECNWAVV